MWRRLYLLLVLVRLYFALSPSYIHPDEHFQGPEIIAGEVFGWPVYRTWEFTSSSPIRSVFPLWLIYGPPLTLLKWMWEGLGYGSVPPYAAYYALRLTMFTLSFVLEDWALDELLPLRKQRRLAILLISSSYVTWTFQSHTFSNSIETLIVLWCLVLIRRIRLDKEHTQVTACVAIAFLSVLGTFNRITFPAFLMIPAAQLLPHLFAKPLRILVLAVTALTVLVYAIALDTEFYSTTPNFRLRDLPVEYILTPWNNFVYNLDASNLAQHGLHPFWQHSIANLPQLIGPLLPLLPFFTRSNLLSWSAVVGIAVLSCFRHQEPRFLLPAVPLLLASFTPPKRWARWWLASWLTFNIFAGLLFGTFHQGGVLPAQAWLVTQPDIAQVLWWKTYSPPRWLLNGRNLNITTADLMGLQSQKLLDKLDEAATCDPTAGRTLLVAPASATFLDTLISPNIIDRSPPIHLDELWRYQNHIGLDDLDFGDDGVWPTLRRVIGRRGLVVWNVHKPCLDENST